MDIQRIAKEVNTKIKIAQKIGQNTIQINIEDITLILNELNKEWSSSEATDLYCDDSGVCVPINKKIKGGNSNDKC